MFTLINEMEMAIKINTSIIFGNSAYPMWSNSTSTSGFCLKKKEKSYLGPLGQEFVHQHESGVKSIALHEGER